MGEMQKNHIAVSQKTVASPQRFKNTPQLTQKKQIFGKIPPMSENTPKRRSI